VRRAEAGGVSFYRDRRVLVIGGLGFIGTRLTERLRNDGARITVMNRSLAVHGEASAALSAAGVRVVEGDLRDAERMREAVRGQDVVVNLAGQSGAVRSMEDPWTDLDVNCRGNLVLLEALRSDNPVARLVFVSSRLSYGSGGADPIDEAHVPDPLCVHAVHKLAAEQYLRLYHRIYGLNVTTARLTNPYGPGQPAGRTAYGVVNHMIHLALSGETLSIYGDGRQRRDYIYVDDAVEALMRMAEAPQSDGRLYNVGSGRGTPLVEMARTIIGIAGGGRIGFVPWPELDERIETGDFVADIGRIERELGWTPRVSLADGLERTVAHYKVSRA
jgi:nucleoside-diphosphate-sugar epimerase